MSLAFTGTFMSLKTIGIKGNNVYRLIYLFYWQRALRTTLYALSIHLIIYNNFLFQAYSLQIQLKLTAANNNCQYLKIAMK